MKRSVWEGSRVRLRAVEPSDWIFHHDWNRSTDDSRLFDVVYFPESTLHAQQWAEREATQTNESDERRFQIETLAGELVGTLNTHACNPRAGTYSYGIAIHPAHRQQGYASDAIRLVLRHYFGELRYQKVTVVVFDFNAASIRLHERLGFQLEGRLRRMGYTHGTYYDHLLYGLTDSEFRSHSSPLPDSIH